MNRVQTMKKVVLIGSGGHAKVLLDALTEDPTVEVVGLLDSNPAKRNTFLFDIPILGGDDMLPQLASQGATHFLVAFGSVGDPSGRVAVWNLGLGAGLKPLTFCHPSATVSRHATIEEGAQIMPGVIVNADAIIGQGVIVNTGSVVEHDCEIGEFAHIASGARLTGGVKIGARAHIGAGATVRQGVTIGEGAMVGLGAAVVANVEPGQTVLGVPAKPR